MDTHKLLISTSSIFLLMFSFSVFGEESQTSDLYYQDCFEAFPYSSVDDDLFDNNEREGLVLIALNETSISKKMLNYNEMSDVFHEDDGC